MRRGGALGSGARRGPVGAGGGGGGCVPARVRGRGRGVCHARRGRGWPRTPALRSLVKGPREDTRESPGRPRSTPTRREAARGPRRPLVPDRLSSASVINTTFLQNLSVPAVYPTRLPPLSHLKKNPFDLSFSDFSENPAPGTLSPVSFIQWWPCLRLPKTCSPPTPTPSF